MLAGAMDRPGHAGRRSRESIMPQTREHFDICRCCTSSRPVALTKSDLVDEELLDWRERRWRISSPDRFWGARRSSQSARGPGKGLMSSRPRLYDLRQLSSRRGPLRYAFARRPGILDKGLLHCRHRALIAGELKVGDDIEVLPGGARTRVRTFRCTGTTRNWLWQPTHGGQPARLDCRTGGARKHARPGQPASLDVDD